MKWKKDNRQTDYHADNRAWRCETTYVEKETGLILQKYQTENEEYLITEKEIKYELGDYRRDKYKVKKIIFLCRKGNQLSLF